MGGTLLLIAGLIWQFWMPFNQRLWTNSFALYISGLSLLILAVCYWWVDLRGQRQGTRFFVIFGANAILAWCGSQLLAKTFGRIRIGVEDGTVSLKQWIYEHNLLTILDPANASLVYSLLHVGFWFGVLTYCYRRKWFWKI